MFGALRRSSIVSNKGTKLRSIISEPNGPDARPAYLAINITPNKSSFERVIDNINEPKHFGSTLAFAFLITSNKSRSSTVVSFKSPIFGFIS